MRLQENGEVWVSWFVGYFIRIVSSVGAILNIPNAGESGREKRILRNKKRMRVHEYLERTSFL